METKSYGDKELIVLCDKNEYIDFYIKTVKNFKNLNFIQIILLYLPASILKKIILFKRYFIFLKSF